MSVYWDRSKQKSGQIKSNFTKDADIAFDDFCKKFLNSSNGFFIAPDVKQTELKQIQNTNKNIFNTYNANTNFEKDPSAKLAQKPNQSTRTLNVKSIKEVTRLDLEKKTPPKTLNSPTRLLKQQRVEVNNTRDILREKLVQSIAKYQSQTSIDSKSNDHFSPDNLNKKRNQILRDLICSQKESVSLMKNRSEIKLSEPHMYCKTNNATMPIKVPSFKKVECEEKHEITDLFNNPNAEFVVTPISLEKKRNENNHSTYFGSLSINDFKNKLKKIDTLSQIYLKDSQKFNLSQNVFDKVLNNSSLNLGVTVRNHNKPDAKKTLADDNKKSLKAKNLNNSEIFLNKSFNKMLNDYLIPLETLVKEKSNLNVS